MGNVAHITILTRFRVLTYTDMMPRLNSGHTMFALSQLPINHVPTFTVAQQHWVSAVVFKVGAKIMQAQNGHKDITFRLPLRPDLIAMEQLVGKYYASQGYTITPNKGHVRGVIFSFEAKSNKKELSPLKVTCRQFKDGNVQVVVA